MVYRILTMLLLALLIALCSVCSGTGNPPDRAGKGVLNLSATTMSASALVSLDGEWEFYWKKLLSPDDFRNAVPNTPTAYISLPGAWNDLLIQGEKAGARGYATYRLVILPGGGERELALKLADISSAYKLWANGKLIAEGGKLGKDAASEIPNQSLKQPRILVGNQPTELILQVSNYHNYQGGVLRTLYLGPVDSMEEARSRQLAEVLLCAGSMLIMGIYHIVLFAFRRKNIAPLYFGLYCLCWTGFLLASSASSWTATLFIDSIPYSVLPRVNFICFVISNAVCYSFLRALYPQEFKPFIQYVAWGLALIYSIMGVALPIITISYTIHPYYIYSILLAAYILFKLWMVVVEGRAGGYFILTGIIILSGAGINDILLDMGLLRSVYLAHFGMFSFILFQALALSQRFSQAFSAVEQLSGELVEKNQTLEEGLAERNRLEREIINISEEERRSLSHHLHDGLCQQLTGARLLFSALARDMAGAKGDPGLLKLSSLLEESAIQAYDLSRGLWPVEHDPDGVSPSLEELTRRLSESSGINIQFSQKRGCAKCVNTDMIQLYRIAQEAVTNAVKHARPEQICVSLNCCNRSTISMTVHDNGIGRCNGTRSKGGLGLGIMCHRAGIIGGKFSVTDAEGGGTLVSCIVPCDEHLAEGIADGI